MTSFMIKIQTISYNQSYIMALDIIETKLFKEPKETTEHYFPKYRSN